MLTRPSLDASDRVEPGIASLSPRTLKLLGLGLLALGIAWRALRYFLNFPIWGDEAMLALNFAWFDYAALTSNLVNFQIAPLLFLWGERLAFTALGPSEFSLRLLPFLAGIASLGLFWRLTGLLLQPTARLFAVGFLAVAIWPVSMGALIKPYSLDLLVALLFLTVAAEWRQRPERTRRLMVLTILGFLAPLASYPSVFVGGAVSLALLAPTWQSGWRARGWFAAYNVALLMGFALTSAIAARHLGNATSGQTTQAGMHGYWAAAFPPDGPVAFLKWFVLQTAGQMTAYPIGASSGGSIVTVVLGVAGVVHWVRRRESTWLVLLLCPFLLNLIAAALHRYPYGGSCRLSQSLAPSVCILAGLGAASLLHAFVVSERRRRQWILGTVSLLALVGIGGAALDVAFPYRIPAFAWMRSTWAAICAEVAPTDAIVVDAPADAIEPVFAWHLVVEHPRVFWGGRLPPEASSEGRVWSFSGGLVRDAGTLLGEELHRRDPSWRLVKRLPFEHRPKGRKDLPQWFELVCFERFPTPPAGRAASQSVSARAAHDDASRR